MSLREFFVGSLASAALFGNADAFWRMNCAKVQTGRIDPIISPGKVSSHAHTIVGAANIGVNATYNSLFNSQCTSCEIQDDKSAYWSPLLYYHHANGSFEEVPHYGSVIYYLARGVNQQNIVPFPPGFQMLSGNTAARSYDNITKTWGNATYASRPIADRVSFNCLAAGPPLPEQPYMFDTDCANGLRAQIHFQSCWNGIDLYKSDQSHVAYLSQIDDGACPPGYPVQLPHLFMETLYGVANVDTSDGGQFVFAMGDPTGYGFHADFQNGWNKSVQADAVSNCLIPDNFGQISYCPSLQQSQTDAYAWECPERSSEIDEQVKGMLDKLPGCINITSGPSPALGSDMTCPSSVTPPRIIPTADTTPIATASPAPGDSFGLKGWNYVGCANDTAGSARTLNGKKNENSTSMSTEYCQSFCATNGYKYAGTEYGIQCFCDNFINPSALLNQTKCYYRCSGNSSENCGGGNRINLYNNTLFNPTGVSTVLPSGPGGGIPAPTTSASPLAPNYLGCATDSNSARSLANASTTADNMTLESCATFCTVTNNYALYGTEYSSECFCGNTLLNGGKILPSSDTSCNDRCSGNNTEVCGGSGTLSLYNNTAYVAPSIVDHVGKYVTKGCLTDPNNGKGRALAAASTRSDSITVEVCVKFCLGKGMKFAGVEFGDEYDLVPIIFDVMSC
ncbi:MAG: hypothetical protein M1820_000187 [Bogoriella megaspora]|nr:MAG: hypothetical protein M1820_000187 [Bogoriella megaspora]